MKRFVCVLLILCLVPIYALCESFNLSMLTYEELFSLRELITVEMMNRPETETYTLNAGVYRVGVDIPSGEYIMKCGKSSYGGVTVKYDEQLNDSLTDVAFPSEYRGTIHEKPDESHIGSQRIFLKDGYYIGIEMGQVIFYAKTEEAKTN